MHGAHHSEGIEPEAPGVIAVFEAHKHAGGWLDQTVERFPQPPQWVGVDVVGRGAEPLLLDDETIGVGLSRRHQRFVNRLELQRIARFDPVPPPDSVFACAAVNPRSSPTTDDVQGTTFKVS